VRPTVSPLASADELLAWIGEAHEALDYEIQISTTWLRALAAQPERHLPGQRRTSYLETADRLQRERLRDPFPADEAEAIAWRDRQDRRELRIAEALDRHADALVEAAHYVRRTGPWRRRGATQTAQKGQTHPRSRLSAANATLAARMGSLDATLAARMGNGEPTA
jgi:hypothetical protein